MIVLGFDTATQATAVGLRLADGTALQARDDPGEHERPGHATRLLEMAARLLGEAGISWNELERVAVGVGPGRFTGLRVGIATARGLGQSLGIELAGVSSLRALARPAGEDAEAVLAVIDARRGEVFAAAYAAGRESTPAGAVDPARLKDLTAAAAGPWLAVGDGAVRYRDHLLAIGATVPGADSGLHRIAGAAICELAAEGEAQAPEAVLPDYWRRPDAEVSLERAVASAADSPAAADSVPGARDAQVPVPGAAGAATRSAG
jgi:tRNA threonylcarbamoyladenosine biosynthesis protein TsaB